MTDEQGSSEHRQEPCAGEFSQQVEYDLNALIEGITEENSHSEIDFGKPVGLEQP